MKTIIIFDESSWQWATNPDYNKAFLESCFHYLKDTCDNRGYLYLNRVYESLGLKWNPDNENICFRKENGPIEFDCNKLTEKNAFRIFVTQ